MRIIGLTGSLGTGKTLVAGMFRDLGARIIDADRITHQLLTPGQICYRKVVRCFGRDICSGNKIDRRKLAARVFNDPKQRRRLERLIHPEVRKVVRKKIRIYGNRPTVRAVVLDVPLLFEAGWQTMVDVTVMVMAKQAIQLQRMSRKTGMTRKEALGRIRAQISQQKKSACCDYVIHNNGSIKETEEQVLHIWKKILDPGRTTLRGICRRSAR